MQNLNTTITPESSSLGRKKKKKKEKRRRRRKKKRRKRKKKTEEDRRGGRRPKKKKKTEKKTEEEEDTKTQNLCLTMENEDWAPSLLSMFTSLVDELLTLSGPICLRSLCSVMCAVLRKPQLRLVYCESFLPVTQWQCNHYF